MRRHLLASAVFASLVVGVAAPAALAEVIPVRWSEISARWLPPL